MSKQVIIVAALVVLAAGIGGWWLLLSRQIAADYASALALCETDKTAGSAAISALDKIHGESARPSRLNLDIAMCALGGSVERVKQTSAALNGTP